MSGIEMLDEDTGRYILRLDADRSAALDAARRCADECKRLRADLTAALALVEAGRQERERLRKTIERAAFLLGGLTFTTDDCDERALRENAAAALNRLRAALAPEENE